MKKRVWAIIVAFVVCSIALGQVDYKAKGLSYVANGNYEDAQSQFEAAKAVLESKKVNKNSQEYIDIEKKISYAKQCLTYSKQVSQVLSKLTDSDLQDSFAQCSTEAEADEKTSTFLSSVEKAENALKNIKSKFSNDKVATSNLQKCAEIKNKINSFRGNFSEVLAWKKASEANMMSEYEAFLKEYPKGNYANAAKTKINEFKEVMAWAETSSENTYDGYVAYIKSFPTGAHAEEANRIINELGDEACWASMNEQGTTESYNNYLAQYPRGKYITYAKQRLEKCKERDYWEAQASKNTVTAYKNYMSKYPKGTYVTAAQNGIDKIGEVDAWNKALQTNTIEGYQAYLNASKKKAYKQEAEVKIASIKHEQEVAGDEALWAKIRNATVSTVFYDYIKSNAYKGHDKEARFKYNVLKAREYPMDITNAEEIVNAFGEATKYGTLESSDKDLMKQAQELSAYGDFVRNHTISNAKLYLITFPQGIHSTEVSNEYSKMLADGMTMGVSESEYQNALSYAISRDAKSYVDKKYRENIAAYKKYQRSLKVEPCHFLLGVEGALASYPYGTVVHSDDDYLTLDMGVVASIGGHSNLFNLELGYSLLSGYASIRPRINLIKRKYQGEPGSLHRHGSDYSIFDLYIAPEFNYFVYSVDSYSIPYLGTTIPTTETSSESEYDSYSNENDLPIKYYPQIDYGIRGGFGIGSEYGTIELFGGYRFVGKYGYIGLSWFFGNK